MIARWIIWTLVGAVALAIVALMVALPTPTNADTPEAAIVH